MRKSSKLRIFTALCAAAVLAGCLTVLGVSADTTAVTDTVIEDFEDAAHVANWHQGIAGATMTQDTSVKHAGNASGRFMFAINYRAFFAVSTRILNASGSVMASSDRALRFISMPDFFRPYMKRE